MRGVYRAGRARREGGEAEDADVRAAGAGPDSSADPTSVRTARGAAFSVPPATEAASSSCCTWALAEVRTETLRPSDLDNDVHFIVYPNITLQKRKILRTIV